MITRTTIGADFEGALTYGAGVRQGDSPKKKAELIGSSNLVDVGNPRGLAAEMQSVADENSKCKNPVWHTSLSWAKGEQLSTEQKLKAAERYCELLRAQLTKNKHLTDEDRAAYNVWEQHQVAVYEHKDKDHDHIHIYINRVPVYGGPAIDTGRNYKFNLKAIKIISEELNLNPLPSQRQSFNDSRPPVQDTRQVVRAALVEAMADPQVQSLAQLQERLTGQGIEARLKRSQAGELVGVSFRQGKAAVTGQEVGMKAAQLREHYEPAQRQAQAQVQQPVAAQLVPNMARPSSQAPQVAPAEVPAEVPAQLVDQAQQSVAADVAREQLRQALAGVLAAAIDGPTLRAGLQAKHVKWQVQQDAAGQPSMSFTQGGHTFQGTELSQAYSVAGMDTLMKANRQAQQEPAAQFVPDVASTQGGPVAAPEQPRVAPLFSLSAKVEGQLAALGLSAAGLAATGQLSKLLAGEMTDTLAMKGGKRTDKPFVSFEGKLVLRRAENGEVTLDISLPRKQVAPAPAIAPVPQVAPKPQPAASEQRPVAAQPPASELKPPPAPPVKPEPPKQAPPKKKGPRLG